MWDTYNAAAPPQGSQSCGSFWWRELIKLMPIYRGVTKVLVNDGRTTLFWKDDWNNAIYADKYPRAFSYPNNEDLSVRDFLTATTLHEPFQIPFSMQAHEELKLPQLDVTAVNFEDHDDVWSYC